VKKGTISSLSREHMKTSFSASRLRSATIDTEVLVGAEVLSDCKISDSAVLRLNTKRLTTTALKVSRPHHEDIAFRQTALKSDA
jgi:hypothetical protein